MATNISNLVVGLGMTGNIKVAAYGVAEGSAVDLGATEGGIKLTNLSETYDVKADQFLGIVNVVKIGEDATVEVTLAESSLANLAYSFGYPTTAVSGSTFSWGGNATATQRTVYINLNAPSGGSAKITLHKCVIIGTSEINIVKNDKIMLKVTFKVLEDTSQTTNEHYGTIVFSGTDTTAPTVAMTTPIEDGTVVKDVKGTVTVTFTETDNAIDEGSLVYGEDDNATVLILNLTDTTATAVVAGSIVYNSATKTLIFTPTANWTASDKLVMIITTGVRDTAGNHLAATFRGHFTVTA